MAEPFPEIAEITVHRMNLCIEVPAIGTREGGEFEKASLVRFSDMLMYIQALVERTKEDAKGTIGGASFTYSTEWNVCPDLFVAAGDHENESS